MERSKLRTRLAEAFKVDHCILIPKETGDAIGHSDGVVRFIEEDLVVVNDYSKVDPTYGERLCRILIGARSTDRETPPFSRRPDGRWDSFGRGELCEFPPCWESDSCSGLQEPAR